MQGQTGLMARHAMTHICWLAMQGGGGGGSRRENAGEGWGRSLEPSMFVWPSGKLGQGGSLGPPRGTVGQGKQAGGTSTTNHDGALNVCLTSCRDRQAWEKVVWAGKGVIRETPTALFILDLGSTASWQVALGNTTMYIFYHVCLHWSVGLQQCRTYDHNVQGNEVKMQWAY